MNDCKEVWCIWENEEFIPCTEMKKEMKKGKYEISHYR